MSEQLASFRDLKGIGPATEARLHAAGIYTWETLAAAASALAAVRGDGDTLREVAGRVEERRIEAGGRPAPRLPGGDRLEAFVLRMTLAADGEPRRCTVTHVRTAAEQAWAGWPAAEVSGFVEERAGLRRGPAPAEEPLRPADGATDHHLVVLDAGKAIGGAGRDLDFVVTDTRAAGAGFDYRATLAARRLGTDATGEGWTTVPGPAGTGDPGHELPLRFREVRLPAGIHRLQLRLEVSLPAPTDRPPALVLA